MIEYKIPLEFAPTPAAAGVAESGLTLPAEAARPLLLTAAAERGLEDAGTEGAPLLLVVCFS